MMVRGLIFLWSITFCFSSPLIADELIRGEQRQLLKRMAPVAGEGRLLRFQKEDGSVLRLHNSFFVVLKDGVDVSVILQKYPVRLVKKYAKNTVLLSTDQAILAMINRVYQDIDTIDAYPNTYRKVQAR